MKKILVVDDEFKIVEVIKSYLERAGYEVIEANNGKEALRLFEGQNPALIVLDLMLPDISGEEVCRTIRGKSRVPIIMLTAKIEEDSILEGFSIGADDYVVKPFSPKQLLARIAAVMRRTEEELIPLSNVLSFNDEDLVIDVLKHEVKKKGETLTLTATEFKLMMCLVKYPQKAFTRDELVNLVLGDDYDGFDRVIDTHVKNLRQKIETNPKEPRYVVTVFGVGYKFGD